MKAMKQSLFSVVSAIVVIVLNLEVNLNYDEKMSWLMGDGR